MDFDMGFAEYMNRYGSDLKMGLSQGKTEEALKLIFAAGFENGIEFALRFQEQSKTEEL